MLRGIGLSPQKRRCRNLNFYKKNANKLKFLEQIREMQFYGYIQPDPCICDYPEGCSADIHVAMGATKDGKEDTLKLRFEYNDSGIWQWIILYTKQPFVLSSCLKKMASEQMMKAAKGQEMKIKIPESMQHRNKKSSIQQKQVVHSGLISRKRFLVRPNGGNCVFGKMREELR